MRQPLFAQRRFDGRTFGALLAVAAVVAVAVAVDASDLALVHEEAYGDQPMLVSDGDDASQPGIFEAQLGEEDYGVGIDADEDVPVELMSQQ